MRRDLDLVRNILRYVESADSGGVDLSGMGEDVGKLAFHAELMAARGLVECDVRRDAFGAPLDVEVTGITWEGYDYLDTIRSPKVWKRAKEVISSTVGDTSLSVVKDACKAIAADMIKQAISQ